MSRVENVDCPATMKMKIQPTLAMPDGQELLVGTELSGRKSGGVFPEFVKKCDDSAKWIIIMLNKTLGRN
jgi:hypothetical protein